MEEVRKTIISFYDRHIEEYGTGAKAVGWNDSRSQEARFAALCKVDGLEGSSILDVGCGFGDLYGYLSGRYKNIDYTGIDINPRYIESAQQLYPEARFEAVDFEEYKGRSFDYVCASGTFAVKVPNYKEVYFGCIKKMFAIANKGVAFTMLDEACHPNDEEYAAYSVEEVRAFCRTLTNDIVLLHDYLPHDFTVILKSNAGQRRGQNV